MALTVMIVDTSEEFRLALESALSDAYRIYSYSNGRLALEAAPKIKPDMVILDLMLTEVDGVTLLHEIRRAGLRPMVLAVTRFYNDYVLESAQELGIGYIIRKPCTPAAVSQRLQDLTERLNKPASPINPSDYVTKRLKQLNFSTRHTGFGYLKEAVLLMCREPNLSITKELYPTVAAASNSGTRVERAIRTAINAAWSQKHSRCWYELFPAKADGTIPRPSNGTVISLLANELRELLAAEKEKQELAASLGVPESDSP